MQNSMRPARSKKKNQVGRQILTEPDLRPTRRPAGNGASAGMPHVARNNLYNAYQLPGVRHRGPRASAGGFASPFLQEFDRVQNPAKRTNGHLFRSRGPGGLMVDAKLHQAGRRLALDVVDLIGARWPKIAVLAVFFLVPI